MGINNSTGMTVLAVVVLIVLAGCLSTTVEVTVGSDGELEEMVVTMEMDETVYDMIEQEALEEGYASVEEYLTAEAEEENESAWDSFSYDEQHEDDEVHITITAFSGDPELIDTIDVEVGEENITFIETDTFDDDDANGEAEFDEIEDYISMEYLVTMPGEIIDTNGHVQDDGQTVRWTQAGDGDLERFEVTSERPSDDGSPGFGAAIAVASLILSIWFGLHRR